MTNVRQWAIGAAAAVALTAGTLLGTGAVSFAQTSTVTPTPAATSAPTTAPSGGSATPMPGGGYSTANCPNMGTNSSSSATPGA